MNNIRVFVNVAEGNRFSRRGIEPLAQQTQGRPVNYNPVAC